MAEQIFREQFGNNVECKICTTEAELNFDSLQDPGRYDIFVDCGNLQTKMYSLIVDNSEEFGCVKQTRIHEGIVDTRCVNLGGIWSDWELISGNGGGGVSPEARVDRVQGGAEITITDAQGTTKAKVNDGEDGGYYVPNAIKTADNSVTFGFTPSRSGMASVPSVKLEAPAGGYYHPEVFQLGEDTLMFSFFPEGNAGDGESVDYTVTLPTGAEGGYYTPEIAQTDANHFDVNFTASKEGMPEIEPVTLTLPHENFTAIYQQTTWAELQEAISAGKHIYATSGDNVYVMISVSSKNVYFSRAQQTSIDYVILNSSDKWSSSSVKIADAANIKFTDGETLQGKYDEGEIGLGWISRAKNSVWFNSKENAVTGQSSGAFGVNNTVLTTAGFSAGANNTVGGYVGDKLYGNYSALFGDNNEVSGNYDFGSGYGTKNRGHYSQTFGRETETHEGTYYQAAFGFCNDATANSLFMVGMGTSDTDRLNVFEITKDGTVTIKNSATGTTPTLALGNSKMTQESLSKMDALTSWGGQAVYLKSPDGKKWAVTVSNTGALSVALG